jgi:Fe2+ transport system protein FeoA
MHSGCTLVCCPNCGYQTVNVGQSKFVRLANLLFSTKSRAKYPRKQENEDCLADVPVGKKAKVIGFTADFPLDKRSYLQAYGLVPNYWVEILAHSPVTIVRLDNIELALENDLARGIIVEWKSKSES